MCLLWRAREPHIVVSMVPTRAVSPQHRTAGVVREGFLNRPYAFSTGRTIVGDGLENAYHFLLQSLGHTVHYA
jgi:hypothetical protein